MRDRRTHTVSNPVSGPSTPAQTPAATAPSTPPSQSSPPAPSSGLEISLAVITTATVNQATTFIASATSSANATLEFGDGTRLDFVLQKGVNMTLTHTYTQTGTFVAMFTATASGQSTSLPTTM